MLDLLQCYQMNFLLKEVVFRQGCPLSPILFNLFINDIQNDCEKYGISIGRKKVLWWDSFADDVIFSIAPSAKKKNLEKLLKKVHKWGKFK